MTTLRVLVDNTAHLPHLEKEHGLSMLLELQQGPWLWDTGASGAFALNAQLQGVDLSLVQGVALSHGHWDHTGGLSSLRNTGSTCPVFAHPEVLLTRYSIHPGQATREIGWRGGDETGRLHTIQKQQELTPGLEFHTAFPRRPGCFQAVEHFFFDSQGTRPDPVHDDAALLVSGKKGAALVLGCCHSGLANTMHAIADRTGLDRVHMVVGGLHLGGAPAEAIQETVEALRTFNVQEVYAGHCTGDEALHKLRRQLPGVVHGLGAGRVLQL